MSADLLGLLKAAGKLPSPRTRVMASLWDVRWDGDGFGKHGRGPFATQAQAAACLRAVGWPGQVERVECTLDQADLERIERRGALR